MRAPIIMVQRKVKGEMRQRTRGEYLDRIAGKDKAKGQNDAPNDKGIIDCKDLLPRIGEVFFVKNDLPAMPVHKARPDRH